MLLLLALLENRLLVSGGPEGHHFSVAGLTICGGPEPFQALIEGGPRLDGVLWLPEHRSGHFGLFLMRPLLLRSTLLSELATEQGHRQV